MSKMADAAKILFDEIELSGAIAEMEERAISLNDAACTVSQVEIAEGADVLTRYVQSLEETKHAVWKLSELLLKDVDTYKEDIARFSTVHPQRQEGLQAGKRKKINSGVVKRHGI